MRGRRKKHLNERLAAVDEILYIADSDDRDFRNNGRNREIIDIDKWFGRKAPLYLEIGCGKGGFAVEYAIRHPEINLLAVEKSSNVLVSACEAAAEAEVSNLRFLKCGAEYLERYIPAGAAERIFLNFSCPFPKKSYASHRLTHASFLAIYKRLMARGAEIYQKTDNMRFFEFSIEQLSQNGFALKNVCLDLHNSQTEAAAENIVTEYEQRFSSLGQPIYRLEAYIKD